MMFRWYLVLGFWVLGCESPGGVLDPVVGSELCDVRTETLLSGLDRPFDGSAVTVDDLSLHASGIQVRSGRYGNDRRTDITIRLALNQVAVIEQGRSPNGELDDFQCTSGVFALAELGFFTADGLYDEVAKARLFFPEVNFAEAAARLRTEEIQGAVIEEHLATGDFPRQIDEVVFSGLLFRSEVDQNFFFELGASLGGPSGLGGPGLGNLMSVPQ